MPPDTEKRRAILESIAYGPASTEGERMRALELLSELDRREGPQRPPDPPLPIEDLNEKLAQQVELMIEYGLWIREDLAEIMALREDLAAIMDTGLNEEPRGITQSIGLTPGPDLGADGRTPTFDDLKATVANLRAIDAPFRRAGWLFHSRLLSTLETVKDKQDRYLADSSLLTFDAMGNSGTLLGYPFQTTSQIPTGVTVGNSNDTTLVIFSSDWQELFVGENQAMTIELSGEASYWDGAAWQSSFQNQQTLFRASRTVDYALRRLQLFTVLSGVRPQERRAIR